MHEANDNGNGSEGDEKADLLVTAIEAGALAETLNRDDPYGGYEITGCSMPRATVRGTERNEAEIVRDDAADPADELRVMRAESPFAVRLTLLALPAMSPFITVQSERKDENGGWVDGTETSMWNASSRTYANVADKLDDIAGEIRVMFARESLLAAVEDQDLPGLMATPPDDDADDGDAVRLTSAAGSLGVFLRSDLRKAYDQIAREQNAVRRAQEQDAEPSGEDGDPGAADS